MNIVKQSWSFEKIPNGEEILRQIELAGRTCWKSEGNDSKRFVKMLINKKHFSVLEHASVSVRIITDRGVTHELVRHRLASYSQESTRFCNYGKAGGITVILPIWFYDRSNRVGEYEVWFDSMVYAEEQYMTLLSMRQTPQEARTVLPNSLKTEIVMTANLREWRYVFSQRIGQNVHPQMDALMSEMRDEFRALIPIIFDEEVA